MRRRMRSTPRVLVNMGVRVSNLPVAVRVRVKVSAMPAKQQAHRQDGGHDADEKLGAARQRRWHLHPQQDERQAEGKQRAGVPETPKQSETRRTSPTLTIIGEDQRRDRGEVIGVGRVTRAEKQGDDQTKRHAAPAEPAYPSVK